MSKKIIFDECIDGRLAQQLKGHAVTTVREQNWLGLKDGQLLPLIEKQFEVFITVDRRLQFQQNLEKYDLAIIVLKVYRIKLSYLQSLASQSIKPSKTLNLVSLW